MFVWSGYLSKIEWKYKEEKKLWTKISGWKENFSSFLGQERRQVKFVYQTLFEVKTKFITVKSTASLHGMGGQYGMGKNVSLLFFEH